MCILSTNVGYTIPSPPQIFPPRPPGRSPRSVLHHRDRPPGARASVRFSLGLGLGLGLGLEQRRRYVSHYWHSVVTSVTNNSIFVLFSIAKIAKICTLIYENMFTLRLRLRPRPRPYLTLWLLPLNCILNYFQVRSGGRHDGRGGGDCRGSSYCGPRGWLEVRLIVFKSNRLFDMFFKGVS